MGSPPVTSQCYEAGKGGRTTKIVTITILSMTGLHLKDTDDTTSTATLSEKKKKLTKRFNFRGIWNKTSNKDVDEDLLKDVEIGTEAETEATDESTSADTTDASSSPNIVSSNIPKAKTNTFVVASIISRPARCNSGKVAMTHLASLPIHIPKKSKSGMIHGIRWPGGWNSGTIREALDETTGATRTTSSYRFKHTFQAEKETFYSSASSSLNSKSHSMPIRISICHSEKLYKLGTATVILSGKMDGMTYVNIPIVSSNPHLLHHTSKFRDILDRGRNSRAPSMMKLRNETLYCGLDHSAAIQLLIQCDDVTESVIEQEVVLSESTKVGSLRVIIAKEKDVLSSKMVGSSPLIASPLAEVAASLLVAPSDEEKELGIASLSSDTEKEETYEEEDVGELSCTSSAYMSANVADQSKTDTDTTVSTYDDMSEENTCLTETTFVELVTFTSADHKPFDQSDYDESDTLCVELPYPAATTDTTTYNCKVTTFQQGIMCGMQMLSICDDVDSESFTDDDDEIQDENDDDTSLLHSYNSQI